jgi:hypothetical protein
MATLTQTLKDRWNSERFDKHGLGLAARKHFHDALDVHDVIAARRTELANDKRLSDVGRAEKLRETAAAEASRVTKAQRALATARDKVRDGRKALTPTVKDRGDIAAAMLRQEVRGFLRGKTQAEIVGIVFDAKADPVVQEAIFEAPVALSGISADVRDKLLATVIERTSSPAVQALEEQSEALDLLETATRVGLDALRNSAGMSPHAGVFEKWLAQVAPVDPKEAEAEAAKIRAEAVSRDALALAPAARTSLIDQLIAANVAAVKAA